ncbi:hypothetical protein CONCODRAFT_80423 [Conidiobolus coronatus NRRL 28638]|uniref:WD40 repeat-like protein n=1 Tax=Conidiobolus coronatus (strain ATCC 28846 / CBS 209.66 / NRRL 28638) TaxID=796925 RepID=A0A137NV30_CONC2|nr:hypothetical protein CONCODRAFT_80423 [Conidiobolus coronatus NRRL 28638]|eukprot:KXN66673.1 hypothetical protein CONCODRAFT_80423 [Conidiobolus coronatus NRRL 28638]
MFITNHSSFRTSAPGSPRIPLIDTFHLVTTSDTKFYQLSVKVKSHSHSKEIEGDIELTQECQLDFKISNTFLIQQHNCLVIVGSSDKFALFDLSGGCLKYYKYPEEFEDSQFCITDIAWDKETSNILFSCVDLPIQRFNYDRKQWTEQLDATFAFPDISKLIVSHCRKYLCFLTTSGNINYHLFCTNEVDLVKTSKNIPPTLIRFAPSLKPILIIGYPKGHIEVVNLEDGASITYQVKDYSTVIDVSFSPQNQNLGLIATSTGRLLQIDINSMAISPYKLLNKTVHTMEFGLDDSTLITSDYNNTLHVFNRYDPHEPLNSIKLNSQFPISKFMPVRCRKWSKITIKSEQTSPKLSPTHSERRGSISFTPLKERTRSNSIVSASSILQKQCSPVSPTRKLYQSSSHIRLVDLTPPKPNNSNSNISLDNYMTLFSPAKNPNQFTQKSNIGKSIDLKPKHSHSKTHLPKLEGLLSHTQTRSRSRSRYSDTSSTSGESPTRDSLFNEESPLQHIRASTPTKKSRQYHIDSQGHEDEDNRFGVRCESPSQLAYDIRSQQHQSISDFSDNASDDLQSVTLERRPVQRNESHLSLNLSKSISGFSQRRPSWQSSKSTTTQNPQGISMMSPIRSSFLRERQNEPHPPTATSQSDLELLMERVCGRIETRVQERIDSSQAQLLAQNAALQEQIVRMGRLLEVVPDIMDELKILREENRRLRRDFNLD